MKSRVFLTLLVAFAIFGAIFGAWYLKLRQSMAAQAGMVRPAPTVATAIAVEEEWRSTLNAVGNLESHAGIVVRTEVEGIVKRVVFTSGARVAAGELLVELDTSVEQAQLDGLRATARLAELQLARARELREEHTNAQADLDAAEAESARARAVVAQLEATIAKKNIIAPFAGRLGITQIDEGQFLNKGDAIVMLESVDPIFVDFGLPQQEAGRVEAGMKVTLRVDAFGDCAFVGEISAVNPRIDQTTRNVRVRAVVPNPDETLRPGMFARVAVELAETQHVLVLPTSSIVYNPYGNAVYVVSEQSTDAGKLLMVRQQFVDVGPARGSQVSILKGLEPGAQVVTAGQIKLRSGMPVQVDNTVTPSANPAPQPEEG